MMTVAEAFDLACRVHRAGDTEQAEAIYRQILAAQSGHAPSLNNLSLILAGRGHLDEALACLDRAVAAAPAYAEAHNNRGAVLAALHRPGEALRSYEEALRLRPEYADARNNLGNYHRNRHQYDEAAGQYREALRLRPDFLEARNNLGSVLESLGHLDEALACYREVLQRQPRHAQALNNLGVVLMVLGRHDEALAHFEEALQVRPDFALAHYNRAWLWLRQGNYEQGWPELEWRWRLEGMRPPEYRQPAWDGRADLRGRTILLHNEMGVGDAIQFIRYAPLLRERGARVAIECAPALTRLVCQCDGVEEVRHAGDPAPTDYHASLASLPRLFGTTLATVPKPIPYLRSDPELVGRWRQKLAGLDGFKVGVAWQAKHPQAGAFRRSLPVEHFRALATLPGVRLLSLHRTEDARDFKTLADAFPLVTWGEDFDTATGAFLDAAALITQLDLVVSADTSLAHLAGALGVPVWVVQPFAPDWRWLHGRQDSPWYPTMRLFVSRRINDWPEVFTRVREELRRLVK